MRALLVLVLAAGCQSALTQDLGSGSGSGSGSNGAQMPECQVDKDCILAGPNCCDCPTFAEPVNAPAANACAGVMCPASSCPTNLRAACSQGACTIACVPSQCVQTCANGFQIDASGCLECACASDHGAVQCLQDSDCVRVRADCCGCARGGTDTAVPAGEAASFDASLMCPANPSCQNPDTCAPGLEPRCIQGACELASPLPPGACGLGMQACPPGQACIINASDAANQQGVGVCM
jgi:hypothetical protein